MHHAQGAHSGSMDDGSSVCIDVGDASTRLHHSTHVSRRDAGLHMPLGCSSFAVLATDRDPDDRCAVRPEQNA